MEYTVIGLYPDNVDTQSVSDETVQKRIKALMILRILSSATLIVSFCNAIVGIVIIDNRGNMEIPLTSGAPIWSGLLVLVCSLHGLKVSWIEVDYDVPPPRASFHMKAYHNLNRVSILTSLACIAFSVVYVLYCGRDSHNPDSCPPNEREEMISNILAMLISFIMIICSIMGIILFQINSKVLGLKNLLERVSEENRNASQEQTEYTTRSNRLEGLELQTQIITDIENRITEFENISHSQRLGPQRYDSNFLDPNAPPPYERNSSDPTEFEYRNTEFQNNSHPQRFGLPPYDNNDSDLTEISHGTTEMEINSHPQRLEPPPYDSSLPDPMSTPPPYESNPSDTTEIDYRNTGFQNNSNLQRLGLPSYDDVSDSTEIGSRTTEFENYSHHQNFATPVDYNSIDLTEPPPTYEEYMRNL